MLRKVTFPPRDAARPWEREWHAACLLPAVTPQELKARTQRFGLTALQLYRSLPRTREAAIVGNQMLRAAMSVGANYRAACLACSRAAFIYKLELALEEADESAYWLEVLHEGKIVPPGRDLGLLAEARELSAIMAASLRAARAGQ